MRKTGPGDRAELPAEVVGLLRDLHRASPADFCLALERHASLKQLLEREGQFEAGRGGTALGEISTSDVQYLRDPRLDELASADCVSLSSSPDQAVLHLQTLKQPKLLTLELGRSICFAGWKHHGIPGSLR